MTISAHDEFSVASQGRFDELFVSRIGWDYLQLLDCLNHERILSDVLDFL